MPLTETTPHPIARAARAVGRRAGVRADRPGPAPARARRLAPGRTWAWSWSWAAVAAAVPMLAPTASADPAGVAVLREADAALRSTTAVELTGRAHWVGALVTEVASFEGTVMAEPRAATGEPIRLRVEGTRTNPAGDASAFVARNDGVAVVAVNHGDRQIISGPYDSWLGALGENGGPLAAPLLMWEDEIGGVFRDGAEPFSADLVGEAMAGGQLCDVLRLGYSQYQFVPQYESWLFIAKSDRLPRRLDMTFYQDNAAPALLSIEWTSIRTQPEPFEGEWMAFEVPAGYELIEYDPQGGSGQGQDAPGTPAAGQGAQVGQLAPDFTLSGPGGAFTLSDARGGVVVLDFWATWCPPCRAAMPELQRLHERFADQDNVRVFGMNASETADPIAFVNQLGLTYGQLLQTDAVAQQYAVTALPTLLVIGPDGRVAVREEGFLPGIDTRLGEEIEQLLDVQ